MYLGRDGGQQNRILQISQAREIVREALGPGMEEGWRRTRIYDRGDLKNNHARGASFDYTATRDKSRGTKHLRSEIWNVYHLSTGYDKSTFIMLDGQICRYSSVLQRKEILFF